MLGDNLSRKTHYLLPALVSVHLLIILCLFSFSVPPLTSDKLFVDQKSAKRIQYKLPNGIWIIPNAKPNLLKSKAFNALKGKFFKKQNFSLSQWNAKAISGWTGRNFESQDPMLEFAMKDEGTRFLLILSRCNCINLATISRFINRIYFIFPA